jgi:hypothetical protein
MFENIPKETKKGLGEDFKSIVKTANFLFLIAILLLTVVKIFFHYLIPNLILLLFCFVWILVFFDYYLLSKKKDENQTLFAVLLWVVLIYITIFLDLLLIFYLSPFSVKIFGSSVWLAFFIYSFYTLTSPYTFSGYHLNIFKYGVYLYDFLAHIALSVPFILEDLGILPLRLGDVFTPGFFYQKPFSATIGFILSTLVLHFHRSFTSDLWKRFREVDQQLRQKTEELGTLNKVLEERVKERTKELEEAKTVLEIKVDARTKELRELAESLDRQVKERTKELQEKMEELEKFNRLAVGRELKMIELKEEIKKLKEELEKYKGRIKS